MAHIFISYATSDRPTADEVSSWLRAAGHEAFLDHDLRDGISVGEEWKQRLYRELREADAVIGVVTSSFVASNWCSAEVGIADALGCRLMPLRAETGVVHPLMRDLQYVDYQVDPRQARNRVLQALRLLDSGDARREGDTPSGEVAHVFFLDQLNQINYVPAIQTEDGLVLTEAPQFRAFMAASFVNIARLQRISLADGFEELINSPRAKEADLQRFFEQYPAFLLGSEYETLHPQFSLRSQVMLHEDEKKHGELRPDFILRPLVGVSYDAKIVELKLPSDRIIKLTKNRVGLYANIAEAVRQLRTYARYFDETENQKYVRKMLGFTPYSPRLTLIVGREIEFDTRGLVRDAIKDIQPVELVTYGDILQKYRRLVSEL